MCEECDEGEPLFVAYFRKAGGNLWRPPQSPLSLPQSDRQSTAPALPARFACDDLSSKRKPV